MAALAALAGGLIAARATAASPSPATSSPPTTGKVMLKIGWMESPDNMNPFIGWSNNVYEIYGNEYLLFVRAGHEDAALDDKGVAKSWEISRRRPHVDLSHQPGDHLA